MWGRGGTGILACDDTDIPVCDFLWSKVSELSLPDLLTTPSHGPGPAEITLALLAGGRGTRMGRPKATLRIHGRPILDYLADRLAWPSPTLLVTAPGIERPPGSARFTAEATDPVAGLGPLRGVLTALEHCRTPLLLVTTVDMPAVRTEHLLWLAAALASRPELSGLALERPDPGNPAVPHIEPFPCAFAARAMEAVAAHLAEGRRSVHSLFARGGFATLPAPDTWEPAVWTNLNHPSDLQSFLDSPNRGPGQ